MHNHKVGLHISTFCHVPSDEVAAEKGALNLNRELPAGFSPEGYHVIGKALTGTLSYGDVIDFGGRSLQVMKCTL